MVLRITIIIWLTNCLQNYTAFNILLYKLTVFINTILCDYQVQMMYLLLFRAQTNGACIKSAVISHSAYTIQIVSKSARAQKLGSCNIMYSTKQW